MQKKKRTAKEMQKKKLYEFCLVFIKGDQLTPSLETRRRPFLFRLKNKKEINESQLTAVKLGRWLWM